MIELSEKNYQELIDARNAFGKALSELSDVAEAFARSGDDVVPEHLKGVTQADLAEAVSKARSLVDKYGEHKAFVFM
jgi:hypothetical protein